jgi:hypothetical protein
MKGPKTRLPSEIAPGSAFSEFAAWTLKTKDWRLKRYLENVGKGPSSSVHWSSSWNRFFFEEMGRSAEVLAET